MNVSEAVARRRSTRNFLDRPVDRALLLDILDKARRAPSNSNMQPWHAHLVLGDALARLKAATRERSVFPPAPDKPMYAVYPDPLGEPYADRRFACGERQYGARGIAREDREGRLRYVYNNHQFFGAPAGLFLFLEDSMGLSQWADLGIYLQTVMLLLTEAGLDSCAQVSWSFFNGTVREHLGVPEGMTLYCGLSIGYGDPADPINDVIADRAPLDEVLTVHG